MAKGLSPQQAAEKYVRRTTAAVADMQRGVESVTTSPTAKAADKKDKMLTNLTASVNSGKWERGLRQVSLEDWKTAMIQKGIPRVNAGVTQAQGKMENFFAQLLPYQADLQKQLSSMPDLTIEDSIQRAAFWIRKMGDMRVTRGR